MFLKRRNPRDIYASTIPQTNDDFVRSCAVPEHPETVLAVRRAIGRFGELDYQFVRADFSFDDLAMDVVDSIDSMAFVSILREELGISFEFDDLMKAGNPDVIHRLPIAEFVKNAVRIAEEKRAAKQSHGDNLHA